MRIGVICGDRYHPADVVIDGIKAIPVSGIEWEFITDTSDWQREQIGRYELVIFAKANCKSPTDYAPWMTEEIQQDFVNHVESGKGLMAIHAGTVGYKEEPMIRSLIGGGFRHHPEPGSVLVEQQSNVLLPEIAPQPFTVHDEHYLMELYNDDLNVFMTSTSPDSVQPAGWTRQQGKGRVGVLTPGHYREVWLQPDYSRTIGNVLRWCLG